MPTTKELTIRLEDQPGTLGKVCRARLSRGAVWFVDPSTNTPVLIFGVKDVAQAALLLDPPAAA
jgi:hypothetical protein